MTSTFRYLHLFNSMKELRRVFNQFLPQIYDIENLRKLSGNEDLQYEVYEGRTYDWDILDNYSECHYTSSKGKSKIYTNESDTYIYLIIDSVYGEAIPPTIHSFCAIRPSTKLNNPDKENIKSFDSISYYCDESGLKGSIGEFIATLPEAEYMGSSCDRHKQGLRLGKG